MQSNNYFSKHLDHKADQADDDCEKAQALGSTQIGIGSMADLVGRRLILLSCRVSSIAQVYVTIMIQP